jgi:hypothetical protein
MIPWFISLMLILQTPRTSCAFCLSPRRGTGAARKNASIHSSNQPIEEAPTDFSKEETLLCVALAVRPNIPLEDALAKVSKYAQSFPFAAVLPVQPLHYLPVHEDGGVELKFLRKKTDMKSGIDGGIRFFLSAQSNSNLEDQGDNPRSPVIEITAKRNSKGQYISKLMAEMLVVKAFCAGISGEDVRFGQPPTDHVEVQSIYHKWMDSSQAK